MVCNNLIQNCPITTDDIKNAHKMNGPDIASLKGKTVRWTLPAICSDYIHVP